MRPRKKSGAPDARRITLPDLEQKEEKLLSPLSVVCFSDYL